MSFRMSTRAALAAAALFALSSTAFSTTVAANVVAGRDYAPLRQPQKPEVPANQTEVIEFFSFACPHCYEYHRKLMAWASKLPANVTFRQVPVGFEKPGWVPLARAAYAMQATGDFARLETALFDAIHKERQPLFDEKSITAWMVKHGVDGAKFTAAYNSFGVNTRMSQNQRMVIRYEVASVPMLVVDGRYNVLGRTFDEMLSNTSALIEKSKAERAGKKS
jgi:protein dithiol oxidoreductase (disulfide-forming)